jgi:EmrB/QacA subfamily drug resistance transporter
VTEPAVSEGDAPLAPRGPAAAPGSLTAIPADVWRVAIVVVVGAFMTSLDTSLVNVGLDTVSHDLNASLGSGQWITSAYLLALGAALPVAGWLGRHLGVGRLWLCSLAAFTAASGLCAAAPDLNALIVLRIVQGVTGGLLIPAGQTLVGRAAGPRRMGRVLSTVGVAVVLGPVIGPTIGGLLIAHQSWRWLFLINLPVGAIALALGLRLVPRGDREAAGSFDVVGLVLVVAGLPLVTYGITEAGRQGTLIVPSLLATTITGVLALALFGWRSFRRDAPLLDLRLFQNRVFMAATASVVFTGIVLFGELIILPLYFQILRHEGVTGTGLLLISFGAGIATMMPVAGRLTDRFGGGIVSVGGLLVTVGSTMPLALLGGQSSLVLVEAILFAIGVGLGLSIMPAVSAAYVTIPPRSLPDATSLVNVLQRVGGALGSALLIVILNRGLSHGIAGATSVSAFQTTFRWITGAAATALLTAAWLLIEQRRSQIRTL